MSYILDALKKAEDARPNRQASRYALDTPVEKGVQTSWLWAAASILLLCVLAFFLLQESSHSSDKKVTNSTLTPASTAASVATAPRHADVKVNVIARQQKPAKITIDSPPPEIEKIKEEPQPLTKNLSVEMKKEQPNSTTVVQKQALVEESNVSTASNNNPIVELHALDADVRQSMPSIHMDAHLYSDVVNKRMVIIDGRTRHEGATLADGSVILMQITRDGIVIKFRGHLIKMQVFDG